MGFPLCRCRPVAGICHLVAPNHDNLLAQVVTDQLQRQARRKLNRSRLSLFSRMSM